MIVFASNFMNHHQLSLCKALYKLKNGNFVFIATEPIPEERLNLGYEDLNDLNFVIKAYYNEEEAEYAKKLCQKADVLIIGSAPESYISIRKRNQIILRYSERPYKNYTKIKSFLSEICHHYRFLNKRNIYILCASAYTAIDHAQFGMYKNKMYKWGYFPPVIRYTINELLKNKDKKKILWMGRLINWKHPEEAIEVALRLKNAGYDFTMDIGGIGTMDSEIQTMIEKYELKDYVKLLGAIPAKEVRKYMEKSGIFLFTSDFNEGWGAVLNESMNSGCAVVASHAIGSVPFLIEHKKNGLVYQCGKIDDIYKKVKYLLDNPLEQEKLGYAAYETMINVWNAEVAAKRLVNLEEQLLNGNRFPELYSDGPCSKAKVIKEDWF